MLGVIGSVISLLDVQRYYGAETELFIDQAIAQDIVNLAIVMPLMAFFAWRALRGSTASYLVWLGFLTFTVYNYFIYPFSIHFGPLFLLWVAVLGTSIFALVGGAQSLDANAVANALDFRKERLAAGFLMLTAVLFALLWLSDIVPALVDGSAPTAATDVNLPTNPVHVLDLAFFLPASRNRGGLVVAAARARLRRCTSDARLPGDHRVADPGHGVRRGRPRQRTRLAAARPDRHHHRALHRS